MLQLRLGIDMGLETKPVVLKVALLLKVAGPKIILLNQFCGHCFPKKNESCDRYLFLLQIEQIK